ncbi:MAG: phage terminase large subunit family protein [Chthoniobacterales bacterium]
MSVKSEPRLTPEMRGLIRDLWSGFRPPPRLTLSEWSDRERILSSDTAAEPGRWKTSRFEPQRGVMDSITANQRTCVMKAAQLGFSEILLNCIGYHIDQDPAPMLVVQPNKEPMAKDFSADRLAPMIRDTPCLNRKVSEEKSRDTKNTILNKTFPGGNVSITGAESPAGLRSKPKRVVLFDEVDAYNPSAGNEGDPITLGEKRAANFWNRRFVYISTPTIKGLSRIEKLFEQSDKRFYHIPCPRCGAAHILKWSNVKYDNDDPKTARFVCPVCAGEYSNSEKNFAVKNAGKLLGSNPWVPTDPSRSPGPNNPNGIAGFHISELYSSWRSIHEIVHGWIEAKGDQEQLQVFFNTVLGELWVEGGLTLDEGTLAERCEDWVTAIPEKAMILTAGADVQADRIEIEVVAWGPGEESWSLDYKVFHGNPDIEEGQPGSPWDMLTDYIRQGWEHPLYGPRTVEWMCIDTGGTDSNTTSIYKYARRHKGDRIFAVKGRGGEGVPIISRPSKKGTGKKALFGVDLYTVGTDLAKTIVMRRLRLDSPGPGYCHFPAGRGLKYFEQLTAEKPVTVYKNGFPHRTFVLEKGRRNEALDCRVYAFAALTLAGVKWEKLKWKLRNIASGLSANRLQRVDVLTQDQQERGAESEESASQTAQDPSGDEMESQRKPIRPRRRRSNFISAWR